jgi:serine/threonine-protein kinase
MSFFSELKRRRVLRVTAAYVVVAWAAIQASDTIAPRIALPDWTTTLIIFMAAVGFPAVVIFAWIFDIGPAGIERTEPAVAGTTPRARYLALSAVVVLALLSAYAGWQRYGNRGDGDTLESIAVLPFANMSGDPAQEPFADGISEEILNALAQVNGLSVAARTSAFAFKNATSDVRDIARKLGVAAVLEGSVRKSGNQLRITAQLINASNGYHLWSETYDRSASDIFAVQDEIARAIVDALKIKLVGNSQPQVTRGGTTNLSAHELYLLGLHHFAQRTTTDMERAIQVFEQAVEADSSYALAHAGLATVYAAAPYYTDITVEESARRGRAAAMTALALDSTVAEAYAALGDIAFHADWDLEASEQLHRRAIALKPSYMQAYDWLAEPLFASGRLREAEAASKRALELDPLALRTNVSYGYYLYHAGDHEGGLKQYQRAHQIDSTHAWPIISLIEVDVVRGQMQAAAAGLRRFAATLGPDGTPVDLAARALLDPALRPSALHALDELAARKGIHSRLLPWLYLRLGGPEKALDYLDRMYADHDGNMLFMFYDLRLAELRREPRFRALAQKVGITPPSPISPN